MVAFFFIFFFSLFFLGVGRVLSRIYSVTLGMCEERRGRARDKDQGAKSREILAGSKSLALVA